jgi:hypothetical protein
MVRGDSASGGIADLLAAMPSALRRPAPVSAAGSVMVSGIARRSRRVFAPRYVPLLLDLRTLLVLADPLLARMGSIRKAVHAAAQWSSGAARSAVDTIDTEVLS